MFISSLATTLQILSKLELESAAVFEMGEVIVIIFN